MIKQRKTQLALYGAIDANYACQVGQIIKESGPTLLKWNLFYDVGFPGGHHLLPKFKIG